MMQILDIVVGQDESITVRHGKLCCVGLRGRQRNIQVSASRILPIPGKMDWRSMPSFIEAGDHLRGFLCYYNNYTVQCVKAVHHGKKITKFATRTSRRQKRELGPAEASIGVLKTEILLIKCARPRVWPFHQPLHCHL